MKWTWEKLKSYNHQIYDDLIEIEQEKNKKFLKEFNELMDEWKISEGIIRDKMIIADKNKSYLDGSSCHQILRELQRNRREIEALINNFYRRM